MDDQNPLTGLIQQLSKLPGVGPRSAQRLAFFFLSLPKPDVARFSDVLLHTRNAIQYCKHCFNLSFSDVCFVCSNPQRNQTQLCIVAEPRDLMALERTGEFKGRYHVLGGLISPIDGIHPDVLRIPELIRRLKDTPVQELIVALNPTIEGDTTALYLGSVLKDLNIPITKLAYGLPVGADIDYADEMTLQKAYMGRTKID